MKSFRLLFAGIFLGVFAIIVWVGRREKSAMSPVAPTVAAPSIPAPPLPAAPTVIGESAQIQSETAATARMYAAHAPLRVPEVADPDSASNKQILATMVAKALAAPAAPPPAPASGN